MDYDQDPEFRTWSERVRREVLPMMQRSKVHLLIMPRREDVDIKVAVELGLMILLEKPIILVRDRMRTLPEKLRRIADHILEFDSSDPASLAGVAEKIKELLEKRQ